MGLDFRSVDHRMHGMDIVVEKRAKIRLRFENLNVLRRVGAGLFRAIVRKMMNDAQGIADFKEELPQRRQNRKKPPHRTWARRRAVYLVKPRYFRRFCPPFPDNAYRKIMDSEIGIALGEFVQGAKECVGFVAVLAFMRAVLIEKNENGFAPGGELGEFVGGKRLFSSFEKPRNACAQRRMTQMAAAVSGIRQGHAQFETQIVEIQKIVFIFRPQHIDDRFVFRDGRDFLRLTRFMDDARKNPNEKQAYETAQPFDHSEPRRRLFFVHNSPKNSFRVSGRMRSKKDLRRFRSD